MNSFLKWAGSKRKILPKLISHLPKQFDRYVEPFAGSACLFFALMPKRALLADINEELIETYQELRDRPDDVVEELSRFTPTEASYYRVRGLDSTVLSPSGRAARFIYLNRYCFNGLYRTNKQGRFNVPFGGKRSGRLPSPEFLRECATALKKVVLKPTSFEDTLAKVKAGDFVYLDPPYCIRSRRVFNEYSNASFGEEQLQLLRGHLKRLDRLGIPFLVSYGLSKEAIELSRGFYSRQLVVQRQIAGFATNRRKARELVITNYQN